MVTLIWSILAALGKAEFTWVVPLVEYSILGLFNMIGTGIAYANNESGNFTSSEAILGVAAFAFYKLYLGLTVNPWFVIASSVVFPVLVFIPGGHTIFNLVMQHYGLLILPQWALIVGIVLDVIELIIMIVSLINA